MKTSLEKANEIIETMLSQLSVIDDTLKRATPEQLRVFLRDAEIEKLGNRLENSNPPLAPIFP